MIGQGIIVPVEGNTNWIREKQNGRSKDLNKANKRVAPPSPITVWHNSHAIWICPVLQARHPVLLLEHQIKWRINTPHHIQHSQWQVWICWNAFWVYNVPKYFFQKKIYQTYEKCKGTVGITDDHQVYGNEHTHYLHLHEAMEWTRRTGIKLNYDKCIVKSKSCSFFVNIYTPKGVKWNPGNVNGIVS